MKKFLLSGLTILMSTLVWAVAGEEVAGSVSVPAPRLTDVASESSRVSLFSSGGTSTYRYTATGDLSTSASGDDITLYFDVSDYFAEIKSARIELMAYDVDYPRATEADITYLNGVDLGQWLKGENGDWEKNTIQITNLSILKTPAVNGGSVRNTFYVDVNAHNGGWVTCISEAILIIEGTTFTVTASDGTDAEGVHVQWTSLPNATYTLWRGEKPGEKTKQLGEGVFTTTEFLDTEVSSGKVYYYTVEVTMSSNESVMASDSGYHDNGVLPNIEKIELPDFWLENKAPIAITWNDFDDTRYQVKECELYVLGLCTYEFNLSNGTPNARIVDDVTKQRKFTDADFGNHNILVAWKVKDKKKNSILWKRFSSQQYPIKIFFNKYEETNGKPNWYYFWPKTGAITEGYIGDGGKFAYSTKQKNGSATPNYEEKRIGNAPEGFPNIYEILKVNKSTYEVTSYGARRKKIQEVQKDGEGGICIGGGGIGLKSLQLVLSHELKHGELFLPYYNLQKGYIRVGKGELKSDYTNVQEILENINNLDSSKFTDENWTWLKALITAYKNNTYVCDLDGDYLLDHEEAGYGYGFVVGDPDTYNLKKYKDKQYATYGDNEFLAIKAEEKPNVKINPQNDWAFPGTKLCGESEEDIDINNTMTPKEAWDNSDKKKEALKTFDAFGDNPRSARSVAMMSLSSDEDSLTMQTLSLTDDIQTGGDLGSLPELFETKDGTLSIASGLIDQTPNYAVLSGYTSLAISLSIANEGESYNDAEISAYLVDAEGAPVAFAQTTCNLPNGKTEVILEFPGASLRRIKTDSYQLALIQVRDANSEFCDLFFSKTQFENNTFAYNNTQFTGLKANFLYNTFTEEKTQEVLTINVNTYVSEPGVYQIEARLEDLEGNMISHIANEVEFASGEMTASFVFPNEEIYLSRQNGPYDICFVRISQDGVVLDERRMPYQTNAYSYADFTPEHVCLVVDEDSFKRGDDVVGTDGLISNLSFSFDVDYQGEETTQCQGRLSIYGANDTIVAVSQENFSLVKGRNTLEFVVDAYSIQKSGVNGPYYVKEVYLRPQNGAAECFEPKMAPIELNADDFGAYPFVVTNKVVARENNGNYDLIVPIEIDRAHTLTLYAMLVDTKEQCVATATTSKTYSAPCEDELILTFTAADIAASGRSGPYKVRLIQATTNISNIEMVSIPVPICTPTYEVVNDEVTITGCTSPLGALEIPDVIEGYPVTTIAAEAFKDCSNLTSVTIPSSVTSIGDYAFNGCSGLTSVTIPEGVTTIGNYAFSGCSRLTSVTIPESVTIIGNYAFSECSSLTSVTIPEGVTSIGNYAFSECSSLTSVTIPSSVTSIGNNAFSGVAPTTLTAAWLPSGMSKNDLNTLIIPEGVTSIGGSAFEGCSDLTSVTIPSSVTSIGDSAFEDCESLTSVTIPSSVTSIGRWAFYKCSSLTSVHISNLAAWCGINFEDIYEDTYGNPLYYATKLYLNGELITDLVIPEGVTSIGERAFHCCSSLTSVTIPSSVTSIGDAAFRECSGLTSVTIPSSVTSIGYYAFSGCTSLTSVTIPEGVTSIRERAFNGCSSLTSVTIPSSVTSIGYTAFYDCSSLTSVTIPEGVTTIGDAAFSGCSGLTSVTISSSVTSIGESAFSGCSSLTSVHISNLAAWCGIDFEDTIGNPLYYAKKLYLNGELITDLVIPEGVTSIGSYAFRECSSLISVTIPSSVTSIGYEAFYDCSSLTSVHISNLAAWCGIDFEDTSGNPLYYAKKLYLNGELITDLVIPEGVTTIGYRAFEDCSSLTSVTIPEGVTTIGNSAFSGCSRLTSVTIPSSVTTIGSSAFRGCSSLTSVTIPEGVTSIGDEAFSGVAPTTLTAAWLPSGMSSNNLTTLIIPKGVTSIGDEAFYGCSRLTSVTIPEGVTTIGYRAFEDCSSLTSVTIPEGVTTIGNSAFSGCSRLTSVTIPEGVTTIGNSAFSGCSRLTSVTIPEGVIIATSSGVEISNGTWSAIDVSNINCSHGYQSPRIDPRSSTSMSVKVVGPTDFSFKWKVSSERGGDYLRWYLDGTQKSSISGTGGDWQAVSCSIPEGEHTIQWTYSKNYYNTSGSDCGWVAFNWASFAGCSNLKEVTLPCNTTTPLSKLFPNAYATLERVTLTGESETIAENLFSGCASLQVVEIPHGVTSIKDNAFSGCSSLTSVTIPEGVTSIGDSAFEGCSGLTSVTIPSSVTSIGNGAFSGCSDLTSFVVDSANQHYSAINDLLCSKDGKTLVAYPGGLTSVTIPSSVTSIGYAAFRNCSSLTSVTISEGVTSIGSYAFSECSGLTSVTIPSSVTSIGYEAFDGCSNLWKDENGVQYESAAKVVLIAMPTSMTGEFVIPNTVRFIHSDAFRNCSSLTSVTIPSSVITIGNYAFAYCSGLTSVTIPEGVTSIGSYAFWYCSGLTSVTIPSSVTTIGSYAFRNCSSLSSFVVDSANQQYSAMDGLLYSKDGKTLVVCSSALTSVTIPEGVTSIGNDAFHSCSNLTSVTIPSSVTTIGDAAFSGVAPTTLTAAWLPSGMSNSNLTTLMIPEGVTSIGNDAFHSCSNLTSVTIPSSVTAIGNNAFSGVAPTTLTAAWLPSGMSNSNLTTLMIPEGVTSIGDSAFSGCSGLTSVTIPSSVTTIGDRAFYNCSGLTSMTIPSNVTSIEDWAFYGCSSLTSVTIPEGVTSIGDCTFGYCSGLTSVTIPSSVTHIGVSAFVVCSSLTSVTIPEGVTSIGDWAFYGCSGLTSVTIPSSVTSIGSRAFYDCDRLTLVDFKGRPPNVGSYAFYDIPSSATGSYLPQYASEWEAVISNGKWNRLTMKEGNTILEFLTYEIIDGKVTIAGCDTSAFDTLAIPATIDGYPVTIIGDSAFRGCSGLTSVTIPSSVTSIGSYAFRECSSLTSVTIPSSVTSIGDEAFRYCSSLTSVSIPSSLTSIGDAFSNCSSLTSVTIPSSVTSIGDWAFSGCSGLTSVTIPSSVTSIGEYAFRNCSSLTSVTIPEGVTSIEPAAFYNCSSLTSVTIPEGVTSIRGSVFRGCSGLTSVTIPSSVTTIGYYAFYGCSGLTSVTIPEDVTSIGNYAFQGCSSLTSVTIPSSVITIGDNAFSGVAPTTLTAAWLPSGMSNSNLTTLMIPEGLTSIGDSAFSGCSVLTSVTIPSSVTSIGDWAFYGCSKLWKDENGVQYESEAKVVLINVPTSMTGEFVIPSTVRFIHSDAFYECSRLTSVTIPSSVTSIGYAAFEDCSGLTSVTISEGVTTIGGRAFYDCPRLTSVTIPEGVTSIGEYAFYGCSGLTSVTIPSSVITIGKYAFYGCSSLSSVDFKGEPPSVGTNVFSNISSSATGSYLPQYASEWEAVITDGKWNGLWMLMARPENEILFTWDTTKGFVDSNGNPVFIDNAFILTAEFTMPSSVTSGDVITFHATSLDGMDVGALGMTDWSGTKVNYLIGSSKQLSGGHYSTGRFSNTGNKGNGPGVNVLKIEAESFENGTIATSNFKIDFAGASTVGSIENNGAIGEKGAEGATFGTKPFAFTSVTLPEGATLVSATLKMLPKDYTGPVESFGVNFMHGTGQEIVTNDSFGFSKGAYVAPSQWTNVTASATGSTRINQYMVYWNARGSYQSGCATTSNMGKLLYGYLDDVASWNGRVKAEVMVTGLPVGKQYAVALILSGDGVDDGRNTYNEVFSPILINGETYSYVVTDGVVSLVKGEAAKANHARQWGDRSTAAIANGLVEGSNVVFVEGLSGMTLSITSAMDEKEVSRLTIAGVQVWITNEDVVIPDESKDRDVISVNFLGRATTTSVTEEAGLVPANGWNNLSGNSGTVSSLTVWSDEVSVTKPVELTYSANNVWSWAGATDDYLKGYLDDNGAQLQVSVTNIPFEEYSAIVYMATDVGGANIKPVLINGAYYIGTKMRMPLGYADRVIEQEKDSRLWGESRGLVGEYGRNALRVDGLSGDLSITGARGNGIARNGIAAIQIVNTGAPLLDWQEVDWTAKGQLVKVSELPELTDTCVRLKLADGATLDYDTVIAEGNKIVLEGEGITVNISNIDVSRADVEANISGATTIQTAYTETNGITVDGITYSYFFRGVTDANWETVSNWSSKVRSLGEEIRYVDLGGSYAPGVPDCPALWDYTLLDGEMMATNPTGDDGYKTVQVALLEGWNPRFTVRNGVHLKIATLKKLQIGNNTTDFSEWRIDDASKVTINAMGTSKWEGTPRFYIDSQEGLSVNIDVGQADYYLDDDGSLQTTARIYGVQTVKAVKIDLGDSSQLGKTRISRKLIGFATNDNATFNYETSGVTSTSSDVTPKYANVLENVGDYTFALKDDGYYIEFIAYDVAPDSILLPEGLPEATGEWLTDVLEASGITSGSAVLAEGTTVEALEAARLLGITPSVSVSGNIATVAAESTFEVSEVVVADNAVSLAVTITVEAGRFPTEVSLGGAVKLMVCDTLNGAWTEVTPSPTQIKLTRMSDTEATLAVTQALDTYKFFKVLVK